MESKNTEIKYWTSIARLEANPTLIAKTQGEFTSSPLKETEDSGTTRRDFMKLMAASTALASSACFPMPHEKIMPYVNLPEDQINGVPNYYASTCSECSTGCGILVKTREGRPIKIEGNPDHPMNQGGLCAVGQASILNLYDVDRLRNPVFVKRGDNFQATDWGSADKKVQGQLEKLKGSASVRILTNPHTSPTKQALINEFLSSAGGKHIIYDATGASVVTQGQLASYGTAVIPRYKIEEAEVLVSIDADFLGTWISPVEFTKKFSKKRKVSEKNRNMSRLYVFESAPTVTGANADERFGIRAEQGVFIALSLASELARKHGLSAQGISSEQLSKYSADKVAQVTGVTAEEIQRTAADLAKARGKSIVMAGSTQSVTENALSLQAAVNLLNSMLGNEGATVDGASSPSLQSPLSTDSIQTLIADMKAGKVKLLLIQGVNPAYDLPPSSGFVEALAKVEMVVSFADRADETGKLSDVIMPDNHPLESWGDAEPQKGLYSLRQPTIRSIYSTRAFEDSLLFLSKNSKAKSYHDYLQLRWRETVYKTSGSAVPFELFWESALREGVVDTAGKFGARKRGGARNFKAASLAKVPELKASDKFSLSTYQKVSLRTGSSANNSWLQELPDPVTRMVWDNYAVISPSTSQSMGIRSGDVVKITSSQGSIELPAHVEPGLNNRTVAVAMGYGRSSTGGVGTNIGKNIASLFQNGTDHFVLSGIAVDLVKTGAKYRLADVQEHDSLEGRPIIKEATLAEFKKDPAAGNEEHEKLITLWSGHDYKGYRWAMNIDLNACTGCQACVVGCQSENNIPTVGKESVWRGRIMHWIRIDRYYSGTPDRPQVVHQPMLCQHCENAPCETVCPVLATVHSDEGLNQQIYNRCVGTRYCSNNCPYKVRRFNWFDFNYSDQMKYPMTLSQNPEVTVRSRGVMEKCTFCIQRIQEVKNTAKDQNRTVRDGEVQTACQQSCPADAISFGNVNDRESVIAELQHNPRSFHVLEELNTKPSITYLTKIRNTESSRENA